MGFHGVAVLARVFLAGRVGAYDNNLGALLLQAQSMGNLIYAPNMGNVILRIDNR